LNFTGPNWSGAIIASAGYGYWRNRDFHGKIEISNGFDASRGGGNFRKNAKDK
jgi:hypothetical protein